MHNKSYYNSGIDIAKVKGCDTLFFADETYAHGENTKYTFTSDYKGILYSPSRALNYNSYRHYVNDVLLDTNNTIVLTAGNAIAQNQSACYLYLYIGDIPAGSTFYSTEGRIATLYGIK